MPLLHDPAVLSAIRSRVAALSVQSTRRWGKMTADQMLWHVNTALRVAIGEDAAPPQRAAMPRALLQFVVVKLPWPKGAPTHPSFVASGRHDFHAEQSTCLALMDRFTRKRLDEPWPDSPTFGPVSGRFMSALQAKHLDHHLKQFGT